MDKFITVYAGSSTELGQLADKLVKAHNASGWARCETVKSDRGEYTIKIKGCNNV